MHRFFDMQEGSDSFLPSAGRPRMKGKRPDAICNHPVMHCFRLLLFVCIRDKGDETRSTCGSRRRAILYRTIWGYGDTATVCIILIPTGDQSCKTFGAATLDLPSTGFLLSPRTALSFHLVGSIDVLAALSPTFSLIDVDGDVVVVLVIVVLVDDVVWFRR
ncbi:hypothetical protein TESG_03207 [Trichophyton tonsurans CBS 112818]|uniref:Uncharacterized protein n=1 Tax=Trichophyton tonsurans (strain CBS 112818) TaxID=647933 RepID=F2RWP0_TRIT1|nr:hypothetical protein TESG_03207 [Trichophyton tonsurans CBS 112818]